MIYKRNIELVVKKKKKINMEEKEEIYKENQCEEDNNKKKILNGVFCKRYQLAASPAASHPGYSISEDRNDVDIQALLGAAENLQHDQEIVRKKSIESKIIQELDNISLEYVKEQYSLNTIQESYSAGPRRACSDADPLDLHRVVGATKERMIPYKLYNLYILIITFMNKYKIYIFFLIIFILLLNNYFKPT